MTEARIVAPQAAAFLLDPAWIPTIVLNPGERPYAVFDRDYAGGAASITATTTGLFRWSFRIGGNAFFVGTADEAAGAWKAMQDALAGAGIKIDP